MNILDVVLEDSATMMEHLEDGDLQIQDALLIIRHRGGNIARLLAKDRERWTDCRRYRRCVSYLAVFLYGVPTGPRIEKDGRYLSAELCVNHSWVGKFSFRSGVQWGFYFTFTHRGGDL